MTLVSGWAAPATVVLVDGERLAELMIDHSVGVTDRIKYTIKRVDSEYFGEDP